MSRSGGSLTFVMLIYFTVAFSGLVLLAGYAFTGDWWPITRVLAGSTVLSIILMTALDIGERR